MALNRWRAARWLLLSTVLVPALLTVAVGILILVFYQKAWDVAFGVLVLCFAVFAAVGSFITVFLLRRSDHLAQLQSDFIANVSHEFRTPLTAIRLFVETLRAQRVTDPKEQQRCLDLLLRETGRMEQLVNQVLTWRQAERGDTHFERTVQRLEAIARQAVDPLSLDDAVGKRLELVVEPDLPAVLADADALSEAVRNLVSNALKYSDQQVKVRVHADGDQLAISVHDQGPQIQRRHLKRIFKRFYRVPGTGKQGAGLGLAIAQHVARAHGGSVGVDSTHQEGNIFSLRVPRVPPQAGQEQR